MTLLESRGLSRGTGAAPLGLGVVALVVFVITACSSVTTHEQATHKSELDQESVWRAVQARNATWLENDFAGHLALYHPEFRRWTLNGSTLMTKAGFAALWNSIKANEEVISLEVDREEIVFYANRSVAIAHYTINESWRWIGDDRTNGNGSIVRTGDIMSGSLRFSDVWVEEEGVWLYAGGHRDGMALER